MSSPEGIGVSHIRLVEDQTSTEAVLDQNTPDHQKRRGLFKKIRGIAGQLREIGLAAHFAADVAVGLYEFADFMTNPATSAEGIRLLELTGDESPVLTIGGFGTKKDLFLYTGYGQKLVEANYKPYTSGINHRNWGNLGDRIDEVKIKVQQVADKWGRPLRVVNHSLGTPIGRVLLHELPDYFLSIDNFAGPDVPYPDRAIKSNMVGFLAHFFLPIDNTTRRRLEESYSAEIPEGLPYRNWIPRHGRVLDLDTCRQNHRALTIEGASASHIGAPFNAHDYLKMLSFWKEEAAVKAA